MTWKNHKRWMFGILLTIFFSLCWALESVYAQTDVAFIYRTENGGEKFQDSVVVNYMIDSMLVNSVTWIADTESNTNKTTSGYWASYEMIVCGVDAIGSRLPVTIAKPIIFMGYGQASSFGFGSSSQKAASVPPRRMIMTDSTHWILQPFKGGQKDGVDSLLANYGGSASYHYINTDVTGDIWWLAERVGGTSQATLAVVTSGANLSTFLGGTAADNRAFVGFTSGAADLTWGTGWELWERTFYWTISDTLNTRVRNYRRLQSPWMITSTWFEAGSCDSALIGALDGNGDGTTRPGYQFTAKPLGQDLYTTLIRYDSIHNVLQDPPVGSLLVVDSVNWLATNGSTYNVDGSDETFDFWAFVAAVIQPVRWVGNKYNQGGDIVHYDPVGGAFDCNECGEFACSTNNGTNRYWARYPDDLTGKTPGAGNGTDSAWFDTALCSAVPPTVDSDTTAATGSGINADIYDYGGDTIRLNSTTIPKNGKLLFPLNVSTVQSWIDVGVTGNNGVAIGAHRVLDSSTIELNLLDNSTSIIENGNEGWALEIFYHFAATGGGSADLTNPQIPSKLNSEFVAISTSDTGYVGESDSLSIRFTDNTALDSIHARVVLEQNGAPTTDTVTLVWSKKDITSLTADTTANVVFAYNNSFSGGIDTGIAYAYLYALDTAGNTLNVTTVSWPVVERLTTVAKRKF